MLFRSPQVEQLLVPKLKHLTFVPNQIANLQLEIYDKADTCKWYTIASHLVMLAAIFPSAGCAHSNQIYNIFYLNCWDGCECLSCMKGTMKIHILQTVCSTNRVFALVWHNRNLQISSEIKASTGPHYHLRMTLFLHIKLSTVLLSTNKLLHTIQLKCADELFGCTAKHTPTPC